ncbi:hypothetical protein [Neolewinella persica]|uniref:hypothetical protein n=1 Tax=Neolewinella persica TaxID=70998 RepID=UPI0003825595|nr:hypothetical protein [Neolewinella persica]
MRAKRPFKKHLFDDIGEPTLASSAELRAIQSNCVKRRNLNSFYITIDVRLPVTIFWQHNTGLHFGQPKLTFSNYFDLIHPHWQSTYRRLTFAGYEISREMTPDGLAKKRSYSGYIPMRQQDGSYSWYKQFLLLGSFDKEEKIVHLHHEYLRLGPFDDLRPFAPEIATNGVVNEIYSEELKLAAGDAIDRELKIILTNSSYRNLLAYRLNTVLVDGKWTPPSSSRMQELLSLNQQALNKANTRILRAAKVAFPKCTLGSVGTFAAFLNEIFSSPDE